MGIEFDQLKEEIAEVTPLKTGGECITVQAYLASLSSP